MHSISEFRRASNQKTFFYENLTQIQACEAVVVSIQM